MPRRRAALLGSGALVIVAGAIFGAQALQSQHSATAGNAAMTLSGSAGPGQNAISAQPVGPGPGSSASAGAASQGNSATTQYVYTYTTASAPAGSPAAAAAVPVTTSAPAAAAATAERPIPAPVGDWLLNQTGGNTAVDSTGAHNGYAYSGWWVANSCLFNGSNSQIYTSGPVLATGAGASFTVSAWVYLDALPAGGGDATAISQDGNADSGFYLQYAGAAGRWAFSRAASDSGNGGTMYRALSANAPAMTTWTHLVGVYDASSGSLQLYVNGVPQGTATDSTPFASNGAFAFGRGQHNGQDSDWLKGAIKEVAVYNVALDAAQVAKLS